MDSCRWASYIGEQAAEVDKELIALPENEQVSRGQELMQLLFVQSPSTPSKAALHSKKMDGGKVSDIDWNIVVKHSFIEVVIPQGQGAMKRSMSDSALPRFEKMEKPWKSLVSDKLQDMSDASTNVSIEAEDLDANCGGSSTREDVCWSSDGEAEPEVVVPQTMPYQPCQYMDAWWMPMGFAGNQPALCAATSAGFDQTPAGYDQAHGGFDQSQMSFGSAAYMPMQWAGQTMGPVECHTVDVETDAMHSQEWRTTVMIRNMPNNYTREMLLELVDSMGFAGTYDFAYLPVDFQSQAGLGYAFINFVSIADALSCFQRFEGFSDWKVPSEKVCTVTWSSPTQGLEAHIERYKNSPVMHHSLPDEWKPVLLQRGIRVSFPPPSKPIKTPKVRQHPSAKGVQA